MTKFPAIHRSFSAVIATSAAQFLAYSLSLSRNLADLETVTACLVSPTTQLRAIRHLTQIQASARARIISITTTASLMSASVPTSVELEPVRVHRVSKEQIKRKPATIMFSNWKYSLHYFLRAIMRLTTVPVSNSVREHHLGVDGRQRALLTPGITHNELALLCCSFKTCPISGTCLVSRSCSLFCF